jgi:hypothetical protein
MADDNTWQPLVAARDGAFDALDKAAVHVFELVAWP